MWLQAGCKKAVIITAICPQRSNSAGQWRFLLDFNALATISTSHESNKFLRALYERNGFETHLRVTVFLHGANFSEPKSPQIEG